MQNINFDKLLLKSAFCCMASDGHIDDREIALIKSMCKKSSVFNDFEFEEEINNLVKSINSLGIEFITEYFALLEKSSLTESQELMLIDFAVQTIQADEQIDYSEIKFFKNIRNRLKISNDKILTVFPDFEQFLEEDIKKETYLNMITTQFIETLELPQFDIIRIEPNLLKDAPENE